MIGFFKYLIIDRVDQLSLCLGLMWIHDMWIGVSIDKNETICFVERRCKERECVGSHEMYTILSLFIISFHFQHPLSLHKHYTLNKSSPLTSHTLSFIIHSNSNHSIHSHLSLSNPSFIETPISFPRFPNSLNSHNHPLISNSHVRTFLLWSAQCKVDRIRMRL